MWLLYFAWYDIKTHRVETRARLMFMPFVLCSVAVNGHLYDNYVKAFVDSSVAAIGAFLLFLVGGAILSRKDKDKVIGGGDIKLIPYIAFIYGLQGTYIMLFVFAISSLIAGIYLKIRDKPPRGAAVPFLALSCVFESVLRYCLI